MRTVRHLTLALLALCALSACGASGVPASAVKGARTAIDATLAPIETIAVELSSVGPVLDAACLPVVTVGAAVAAMQPDPGGIVIASDPPVPAAPAPAPPPQPLLPPRACAVALPALDRASRELDRLQDRLDKLNLLIAVIEAAAASQ